MDSETWYSSFTPKEIEILIGLGRAKTQSESHRKARLESSKLSIRRYWDNLSPEDRECRRKINDDRWTIEERNRASQRSKDQWVGYSKERKEEELAKVLLNKEYRQDFAEKRRNMTFEETQEWIGRSFNRPSVRGVAVENMSIGVKKWWASLSKEKKEEEVAKRVSASARTNARGPSEPERIVGAYLDEKYPGEWAYNGDCSQGVVIGNKIPDFININGKKEVIEVFGFYWHCMEDPEDKIAHYKKYGFDCKVIWEYDCIPREIERILGGQS